MEDWVWSYSRIKLWQQCPHAFILKYIYHDPHVGNFYADYGSFIHHILQLYYEGKLSKNRLQSYFISNFNQQIGTDVNPGIRARYFEQGFDYFGGDVLSPSNIIGVEQEVRGHVGDYQIKGYIDLIYDDCGIAICDHKSKILMPRSSGKRKRKDAELDEYLTQLYLYAYLLKQSLGIKAEWVEFNCFRNGTIIREPCDDIKVQAAADWAQASIKEILSTEDYPPMPDFFFCRELCDMRSDCPYIHSI